MRLVKQLVVVIAVNLAGGQASAAAGWNVPLTLILGLATAALAILAYRWIVGRTEKRAVGELARTGAAGRLGRGLLLGTGMFAAVIANIAFLGGYEVLGWGSLAGAIALFGFSAAAAVTEELLFRGVLFRIVEGRFGSWAALLFTSALFGSAHLLNAHASLWGAIAIAIEAGGMLGAAYVATRSLWLPIGLHFGWNFAEGAIFGTAVSGTDAPQGLLHSTMSGPMLLSGGEFGPEGSIYTVLAGAIATIVFMWLARRRGHIVPRRRRGADVAPAAAATMGGGDRAVTSAQTGVEMGSDQSPGVR
ncbi:CPBP family intramembrane glutamic endopeptidase [Paractinoplanes rhizophilus]|uniref:CPBP family intramembrane glutamic endopeptidase n=1 Tax=Paractinoplanes rhizophilus TaxID=1416877 RepID=A0ABW2I417_9ACTN|nr:CPBP family intramembrane glutamic endopeptidase [Actinoplanes sp.]